MAGEVPTPVGEEPSALRQRLAAELATAIVRAEKRLGRAVDRAELARRLNVSASSLYAYLNGTTLVSVGVFDALLDALGISGPEAGRLSTLRDAADAARRIRGGTARSAAQSAAGSTTGTASVPAATEPVPPRQLPPAFPQFVGREAELDRLDALRAGDADGARPVVVTTIEGTAGVGKTTLALHWAHRIKDRFPDGQLHVNLRGFGTEAPMEPGEALHGFLHALGVTPAAIPARPDVASALLRSLLAGRRVLVVLDNARSAGQARPLLPGAPGCLAIVTSRNRLDGLVVREGAYRVTLDVMPRYAARALLERQLGADRLAREPRAADELVDLCARLPLALSVAAARFAVAPQGSLGFLVAELRRQQDRLDALELRDADIDLRTVFHGSYALLPPPVGRLFRLLGSHPGPDIDGLACAALIGTDAPPRALLDTLTAAHLVQQPTPGRFALHDLLRLYARELADAGPPGERRTAVERMLTHYLRAAERADHMLEPWRALPAGPAAPARASDTAGPCGEPPEPAVPFRDYADAMAWFEAELSTLQAVIAQAAGDGFEPYAWRLARACAVYLRRSGRRHQRMYVHGLARDAAARAGDRTAWAGATRQLADALARLDRTDESLVLLEAALAECGRLGDDDGVRHARLSLVRVHASRGDHQEALRHAETALELAEHADDPPILADGLTAVAQQHQQLGRHTTALEYGRRALALYARLGHTEGQAGILLNTGRAQMSLGRHEDAVGSFEQSLALDRALGDRYWEAHALDHLAGAHAALGHRRDARTLRQEALAVLERLRHPDAESVRAKLMAPQGC